MLRRRRLIGDSPKQYRYEENERERRNERRRERDKSKYSLASFFFGFSHGIEEKERGTLSMLRVDDSAIFELSEDAVECLFCDPVSILHEEKVLDLIFSPSFRCLSHLREKSFDVVSASSGRITRRLSIL